MIPYKQRLFLEKKAVKRKLRSRAKKKEENAESASDNQNTDDVKFAEPYKKRTFLFPPKKGMGEGQYLTPAAGSFNEMMDMVVGNQRGEGKKVVIIYPGNFKPFHKKHAKILDKIKNDHPQAEVFIATNDDPSFSFEDKQRTILASGIDPKMTVRTLNLLEVPEIVNKYSKEHTVLIFAVTKKVLEKKLKPDKYLQRFKTIGECKPASEHIYVMTVPGIVPSASSIRNKYKSADEQGRKNLIIGLYGTYKPELHKLFNQKL